MPWGAAIAAGGAILGGVLQSNAGSDAADAQTQASQNSIAEQQREYNQTRQDQLPFLQAGQSAVNLQQKYLAGDTSGFDNSPDYRFALQQGTKQLDAGAAARGNVWGGGADADRISFGQGLATQYANNYWNKLAGMAGQGQTSAANLGGLGANSANQIGNYLTNAGQARASSYANNANAWGNTLGQLGNIAGQYVGYNGNPFAGGGAGATGNYGLGNNLGSYWSNPSYGGGGGGNFNFAAMSGGG